MVEITILADNTVAEPYPKGLRGVYGFAAAVDGVLFDTGLGDVVAHNARLLGLPTHFEDIVLSHGHFDHTDGLDAFLDPAAPATVYLHPTAWTDRYHDTDAYDDPPHIGIPYARSVVESGADLHEHREPVAVTEDIYALGEIPREHDDAAVGEIDVDGERVADPVVDDQAIGIRTDDGVAVVLGCGHSGLRNTIEYAEAVMDAPVRYVLGGTHLEARDDEAVHEIADWLEGRLALFAGSHCTGFRAQTILSERLPAAFEYVGVGSRISLPPDDT